MVITAFYFSWSFLIDVFIKNMWGEGVMSEVLLYRRRKTIVNKFTLLLKKGPIGIRDIQKELNLTERTVYRYFNLLEKLGVPLEKDFSNRYFIVETERCPFCGHTVNHHH